MAGGILLSVAAFTGCQNCDEAVKAAQSAAESKLTSVTDSLKAEWQKESDAVKAEYEAKVRVLDSTLNAPVAK